MFEKGRCCEERSEQENKKQALARSLEKTQKKQIIKAKKEGEKSRRSLAGSQ